MTPSMKQIIALIALFFLAACGASRKEDAANLTDKKVQLENLKKERDAVADKIKKLEDEISKLDSTKVEKAKLISVSPLTLQNFEHYIDLQGKVESNNISYVAPRGQTGQVTKIFVKEGDYVNKGKQILKLDDAVYLKQLQQVESQLEFAKNIYERQKNLWSQNIGTEVQLLTAKNNVETLEKQIATIKEQWSMTNVFAENSGVVETISVRVGELFNVGSITIVNNSDLKVSVTVPENYLSRVNTGQLMKVYFPDVDKTISTKITRVGQVIGLNSRGFVAEGRLPAGLKLKPNQLAQAKILDHASPNAVVIPMNVLQTDEKGKYVFVRVMENGKAVARKRQVIPGEIYGEEIEIKQGLKAGEELITQGYQGLYEGQMVTTEVK